MKHFAKVGKANRVAYKHEPFLNKNKNSKKEQMPQDAEAKRWVIASV